MTSAVCALVPRLQFDCEISGVRFSHEHAQLQSGAARVTFNLRCVQQHLFDVPKQTVSFSERRSGRGNIIEHKRALVEFRQKFRPE
mgnify:CR=1 FL=1